MPDDFDHLFDAPADAKPADANPDAAKAEKPSPESVDDMFAQYANAAPEPVSGGAAQADAVGLTAASAQGDWPDDFLSPGDTAATPAGAAHPPPALPAAPVKSVRIALFSPGMRVQYKGRDCTVRHTVLSRGELRVQLNEVSEAVPDNQVVASLTELSLERAR